jgi:hypothetical protein
MRCYDKAKARVRSPKTKVIFFTIPIWKVLFVQQANALDDLTLHPQAEAMNQRHSW